MGCIFEKKGDIKGGIEFFSMAIDIDPNNVFALFSRGACHNMEGNYEQAISDYSLALEKDSNRNGRKSLKNIGKTLGLNNENMGINNTINSNIFMDDKDINESLYFNLNNSKGLENFNNDNEMNNYINNHLRDIISHTKSSRINENDYDNNNNKINNFPLNKNQINNNNNKNDTENNINKKQSNLPLRNIKGKSIGNNYNINNNILNNNNNNLNNPFVFYNKNDNDNENNNNSNNNFNPGYNSRLKSVNLDNNIFKDFKENEIKKQNNINNINEFINPDDKNSNRNNLITNRDLFRNNNIDINKLITENIDTNDIDNLILRIKNNEIERKNSDLLKLLNNKNSSISNNKNNNNFPYRNQNDFDYKNEEEDFKENKFYQKTNESIFSKGLSNKSLPFEINQNKSKKFFSFLIFIIQFSL